MGMSSLQAVRSGADALVLASAQAGIDVCFANPGTTEMALVAALGAAPGIRTVPVLFEGVASGAADGYARLAGKPAATLLHLGPGLSNASANLHNTRRAEVAVVNWVGEHATWLLPYDPPLASPIGSLAKGSAAWIRTAQSVESVARDARDAVAAAAGPPGVVATLILPDDIQRQPAPDEGTVRASAAFAGASPVIDGGAVLDVARRLRAARTPLLLLGGRLLDARALRAAHRIATASGAALLAEQFPRHLRSEPGLPVLQRLVYFPAAARAQIAGHDLIVLAGVEAPVCFFGYAGEPPRLTSTSQSLISLAAPGADGHAALEMLAAALDAPAHTPGAARPARPTPPTGPLTPESLAQAVAALLPPDAIVVDEAITASPALSSSLGGAAAHDYLSCKGGAIGWGMPAATGAAVAAAGRRVVAVVGDGSAAYTLQALWTQAREGLAVTTVVAVNRRYAILQLELMRSGAAVDGAAAHVTTLDAPPLDYVLLAHGFGVPAQRATTAEACVDALRASFATPGPTLIEAVFGRPGA